MQQAPEARADVHNTKETTHNWEEIETQGTAQECTCAQAQVRDSTRSTNMEPGFSVLAEIDGALLDKLSSSGCTSPSNYFATVINS